MALTCPSCRAENSADAAFCERCGKALQAPDPRRHGHGFSGTIRGTTPLQPPKRAADGTIQDPALDVGAPSLSHGTVVGNWIVERPLGRGGMGEVYLARRKDLGNPAALKVLRLTRGHRDVEFSRRFEREARIQANLKHPHIAHVLDYIRDKTDFYLVIEYLEGGTFADLIATHHGCVPLPLAVKLTRQALEGLEYAHTKGIVHRDVSATNVMLDLHGYAKVTDFGIARSLDASGASGTIGAPLGTLRYMSPEQITKPQTVDLRTDIYSMGVVCYELVTGRPPFIVTELIDIMNAHVRETPPAPRSLNPAIPTELENIILTALAKDPGQRFQSAGEFARALEQFEARPHPPIRPIVSPAAGTARPDAPTAHRPEAGTVVRRMTFREAATVLPLTFLFFGLAGLAGWIVVEAFSYTLLLGSTFTFVTVRSVIGAIRAWRDIPARLNMTTIGRPLIPGRKARGPVGKALPILAACFSVYLTGSLLYGATREPYQVRFPYNSEPTCTSQELEDLRDSNWYPVRFTDFRGTLGFISNGREWPQQLARYIGANGSVYGFLTRPCVKPERQPKGDSDTPPSAMPDPLKGRLRELLDKAKVK